MLQEPEPHILPYREGVEKGGVLEQHTELPADRVHVPEAGCGDELAVDLDCPLIRCQNADDALDENTFPNSALADDDHALPRPDVEVGSVQDDLVPEGFLQVPYPYGRLVAHQNRSAVRK